MRRRTLTGCVIFGVLSGVACGGGDSGGGGGPGNTLLVSPQSVALADCGVDTLTASVRDGDGDLIVGAAISFSSTSGSVAAVSPAGIVTATGTGSAGIVVASGQLRDTVPVTVTPGQLQLTAGADSVNLDPDGPRPVTATVTDCHGTSVANPALTYGSLDPSVASVSNGLIVGEASGLTKVFVSSGSASDTVTVNVYTPAHPQGTHSTIDVFDAIPYAVASNGGGVVYVADWFHALVKYDTLPLTSTVSAQIAVGGQPTDVAFAPRLMRAFVANAAASNVSVIDVATGVQATTVDLGDTPYRVLSARNNRTYVSLSSGRIVILNSSTLARVDSLQADITPEGMVLTPDNSRLYASSTFSSRILVFDLASGARVDSIDVGGVPRDLALSSDGTKLFVANEGMGLERVDLASRTVTDTLVIPAYSARMTPDGSALYVAGGATLTVVDPASFTAAPGVTIFGSPRRIAFAEGGRVAIISRTDGHLQVIR